MKTRKPTAETRDRTDEHPREELRLWLRLFAATTLIENEIRSRLREQFDFTLPRFDMLAQLERAPEGIVLGDLSRRLMVTAGNVTAVCDKLIEDGYISRTPSPDDRRIQIVRMTHAGRSAFSKVAEAHAQWIKEIFDDLPPQDVQGLNKLLSTLKHSVEARDIGRARLKGAANAPKKSEPTKDRSGKAVPSLRPRPQADTSASRGNRSRARPAVDA